MNRTFLPTLLLVALAGCSIPSSLPGTGAGPEADPRAAATIEPWAGRASVGVLTLGVMETERDATGLVAPAVVSVHAGGNGSILIDSPSGLERQGQESIVEAARAAALVAGVDAAAYNYTVALDDAGPMGGPSAGSQFALGFYVALHNLEQPEDRLDLADGYAGTGTISAQGGIGEVGGVEEKAEAVAERGGSLFAYPDSIGYARSDGSERMDSVCDDLRLRCVQVETLAELIGVATVEAGEGGDGKGGKDKDGGEGGKDGKDQKGEDKSGKGGKDGKGEGKKGR